MSTPSEIEKQSLEAHVEICAVRYSNLETKLSNLEQRMDKLEGYLVGIKDTIDEKFEGRGKQSVSILVTVLSVLATALLGIISHFIFR